MSFFIFFTHYGDTEKLSVGLYLTNCFELTEKVFLVVASSKLKYILLSKRIFCAIFKVNKVNIMNPQQHIQERTTYMINIIKISFNQNTFSVSIMLGKFGTWVLTGQNNGSVLPCTLLVKGMEDLRFWLKKPLLI